MFVVKLRPVAGIAADRVADERHGLGGDRSVTRFVGAGVIGGSHAIPEIVGDGVVEQLHRLRADRHAGIGAVIHVLYDKDADAEVA